MANPTRRSIQGAIQGAIQAGERSGEQSGDRPGDRPAVRLGILGGSFNPVHVGHLRLACEASERLGLDRVDLMPAASPPHKTSADMLPYALRLRLVELATARGGGRRLGVSELEGVLPSPSYTYVTLQAYRELFPDCQPYFILGSRDLLTLPSWRHGLELARIANLAVADREGEGEEAVRSFVFAYYPEAEAFAPGGWCLPGGGEIRHFSIPRLDVSSTMIRDLWRRGRSLSWLVPEIVERELKKRQEEVNACWRLASGGQREGGALSLNSLPPGA